MRDLDALGLYDALPPEERAALDAALAETPALGDVFAQWRALRAAVRADLDRAVPERSLLVLHALDGDASDGDLLLPEERAALDAARPALDAALARHPGLAAAAEHIRADRDAFDAAWTDAFDASAEPVPAAAPPVRAARPGRATRRSADRAPARAARTTPFRWVARVAAVLAVVSFAGLATFLVQRDAGWERVGGAQTVTFADGSTATLDEGAWLSVPEDRTREARLLAGRALFRVETDAADPFEVTTPNAEVVVLGTTFEVTASDVETEVVLVEGAVRLMPRATPDAAVRLRPGERSRVLALDAPTAPEPADLGTLAWTGEDFDGYLTAGRIAERLSERFGAAITVGPSLAGEEVAGMSEDAESLDAALDLLARALGAEVREEGGAFVIDTR